MNLLLYSRGFFKKKVQALLLGAKFTAAFVHCARDQFHVHFVRLFVSPVIKQCIVFVCKELRNPSFVFTAFRVCIYESKEAFICITFDI